MFKFKSQHTERFYMITSLFLLDDIINANLQTPTRKAKNYSLVKKDNNLNFTAITPGFDKSNITMKLDNKHLIVTGKLEEKNSLVNNQVYYKVYVGDDIDKSSVSANLDKGVLKITMPIREDKKEYKINF